MSVLVGVVVVMGALPAAAQAALVLDQSSEDTTFGFVIGDAVPSDEFPRFTIAQTFTAGLSGPLGKVELYLNKLNTVVGNPPPDLPITVEIRTVSGLDPSTTVLATTTIQHGVIPIAQEPGWVPATFDTPTAVVAGNHYAIVAYTDSAYSWHGSQLLVGDAYAGGSTRVSDTDTPAWRSVCTSCTPDMAFRTFVDVPTSSPPVAVADAYSVIGGGTLAVRAPGVLGNDTDADGDPLTAQLVTNTTQGTLNLSPNGGFTYVAADGAAGTDSFSYLAKDGTANSNVVNVTITIQAGCAGRRPTQTGTAGNDDLGGSGGNDVILGLGGNDTIEPGSGTDIVCGGPGNDNVLAGSGNDIVRGGTGNDTLDGGSGNDSLFGEAGIDRLLGGGDNDALDGGADTPDRCDGEGGSDTATASCETVISA
jgi:Ca2+-binding RTX toxin-like protein